jgi:hypothetical protein
MRSLALALVGLALSAGPASAAVIEFEDHFCGCDGSSGDEDTRGIIVRAAPGEANRMSIRVAPRGVVIEDLGAPLTGACRPASSGGRFCRGKFDGVEVHLGDGSDEISVQDLGGSVDAGPGDDDIVVARAPHLLTGGAGADRLDTRLAPGSGISYLDHTEGVTVSLNGLADDGAPGEGDNVLGSITSIRGGSGDDVLDAGATVTSLIGEGGNDTLVGGPRADYLLAGAGDDTIAAGDGDDRLSGGAGADVLGGGPGRDEVSYAGERVPLRLSIGDGPGDGAAGEGDDIQADVEDLIGGLEADLIVGDDDGNRLVGSGGRDTLLGRAGADRLEGWNDGDELDAGPGRDTVLAGEEDLPVLVDGEADSTFCGGRAPVVEADSLDVFNACAPSVQLRRLRARRGAPIRIEARCATPSAVPCEGRILIHAVRRHRVLRTLRFGPIEPGGRQRLALRLPSGAAGRSCFIGVAVVRRDDSITSVTHNRSALGCVPR